MPSCSWPTARPTGSTRSRPTTPTSAAARRPRRTCSRSCWAATARSAAGPRCRGSWRSSGPRWRPSSPRAACPCACTRGCGTSSRASATSCKGMAADGVTRLVAIALAPQASSNAAGYRRAVDAALADLGDGRPGGGVRRPPGTTSRGSSRRSRRRPARRSPASTTRPASASCSPPTACPARVLAEGDPYPAELAATARLVAEAPGPRRLRVQLPERRPDRRAVAGPGHPRGDPPPGRRGRARGWSSGRSASSPTTWRSSTTSTSRRRASPRQAGIRLERARSMNTDPTFIAGLADIAAASLRPVTAA